MLLYNQVPGRSKWPSDTLVGGHFTIPKRLQRIARCMWCVLMSVCFSSLYWGVTWLLQTIEISTQAEEPIFSLTFRAYENPWVSLKTGYQTLISERGRLTSHNCKTQIFLNTVCEPARTARTRCAGWDWYISDWNRWYIDGKMQVKIPSRWWFLKICSFFFCNHLAQGCPAKEHNR